MKKRGLTGHIIFHNIFSVQGGKDLNIVELNNAETKLLLDMLASLNYYEEMAILCKTYPNAKEEELKVKRKTLLGLYLRSGMYPQL